MSLTPREQLASATMIATHEVVTNIAKAKAALEALVYGMQDLTCLVSEAGRILWGNEKTSSWMNIDHDLMHKNHLQKLFSDSSWQIFQEKMHALITQRAELKDLQFQLPIVRDSNKEEISEILWSLRIFDAMSSRRGAVFIIVGRDITDVLAERSERSKLESELETAQLIQAAFFPPQAIRTSRLDICSYYRPANQCSGDWWGHFPLGPNLDLVCIGDVTGHGAASALVTAMTQATCMAFARRMTQRPVHPSKLMDEINQIICETFKGKFFMTFFAILFDYEENIARATSAAHNFPFFISGQPKEGATQANVETLILKGNPIGFDLNTDFQEKEFPLTPGDRYILYTDGITECKNDAGKMYGGGTFRRSIGRNSHLPGNPFRDALMNEALAFYGKTPLNDDLTLVTIDFMRDRK